MQSLLSWKLNSRKYRDLMVVGFAFLRGMLWMVFALFLLASCYLVLNACGTWHPILNYCTPKSNSTAKLLGEENHNLSLMRDDALRRLNSARQCAIPQEFAALPNAEPEEEPQPDSEPSDQTDTETEEEPEDLSECQSPPVDDTLVLVDASGGMGLDFEMDHALSQRMNQLLDQISDAGFFQLMDIQEEMSEIAEQANDPAKPNRIDVTRDALRPLAGNLPQGARLKLMSFASCEAPVEDEGLFTAQNESAYHGAVDGLTLRPASALAEAMEQLPQFTEAGRSPDRPVNVVILSDGVDTCRGDPCAAAAKLKSELPHANVSVVSLAPVAGSNTCIAENTGGQLYNVMELKTLQLAVRRSVGQLSREECLLVSEQNGED